MKLIELISTTLSGKTVELRNPIVTNSKLDYALCAVGTIKSVYETYIDDYVITWVVFTDGTEFAVNFLDIVVLN